MNTKKIVNSLIFLIFFSSNIFSVNFNKEYVQKINNILKELDIDYDLVISKTGGKLQLEATDLVYIGRDIYKRKQFLEPEVAKSFKLMLKDAKKAGVNLYIVSAFRSVDYQYDIIKRKEKKGMTIDEILRVNAIPGFSEHQTGRAVDFYTDGVSILGYDFANTKAYIWLKGNAIKYGFRETYSKKDNSGIIYEPWHWYFFR